MNETILVTIVRETCCKCGIVFGMEKEYRQRKIDEGGNFYCPNGHGQHYSDSTISKLERQLNLTKSQKESCRLNLKLEKRSHSATKGHLTRMKNQP